MHLDINPSRKSLKSNKTSSRPKKRRLRTKLKSVPETLEHNVVVNLSHRKLNFDERTLLNKGLGFVPSYLRPNLKQLDNDFERFERKLQIHFHFATSEGGDTGDSSPPDVKAFRPISTWRPKRPNPHITKFCQNLKNDTLTILRNVPSSNLSSTQINILKQLKSDKSITIKKADKGGGIALMDTSDYVEKVMAMLNDSKVYTPLTAVDIFRTKDEADFLLMGLFRGGSLTHKQFRFLTEFIPRCPVFYGLPKLHKNGVPLRPVVSQVNGPTMMINALVDKLLVVAEAKIPFLLQDTTAFLNIIETHKNVSKDTILVTMDICSMYTNIPHDEGICFVCEHYCKTLHFWKDFKMETPPIHPHDLAALMKFILENCEFAFGDKLFKQNFGTTMGAKFSVKYANIYMHSWFSKFLSLYQGPRPDFICRLVDDVFFLWNYGIDELFKLRDYLNSVHQSIKFEMEYSYEKVHFLDTVVLNNNGTLETTIYIKPTDKKQYLHFNSCHPRHVTKAIPYSQAVRYRRIISSDQVLATELNNLKRFFLFRGYDEKLLTDEIARVWNLQRTDTLSYSSKDAKLAKFQDVLRGRTFLPLIIVFHAQFLGKDLKKCVEKRWNELIDASRNNFLVFGEEFPMMVFKRGKTLGSILTSSAFKGTTDPTLYILQELYNCTNQD